MRLLLCASVPLYSEDEHLCSAVMEEAYRIGMDGVEFKLGESKLVSRDMTRWADRMARDLGLKPHAHLPYLHGEANIASPDPARRLSARLVMADSLSAASSLGCEIVNTHLGTRRGGGRLETAADELGNLMDAASDLGIRLAVENQESGCKGILNTPRDLLMLADMIPDVLLTYDAGHGNTHGFGVAEFLPSVLGHLAYLHVHDNDGSCDQHLPLGLGNVDFRLLVSSIRQNGSKLPQSLPVVFEVGREALAPSVKYFSEIWEESDPRG